MNASLRTFNQRYVLIFPRQCLPDKLEVFRTQNPNFSRSPSSRLPQRRTLAPPGWPQLDRPLLRAPGGASPASDARAPKGVHRRDGWRGLGHGRRTPFAGAPGGKGDDRRVNPALHGCPGPAGGAVNKRSMRHRGLSTHARESAPRVIAGPTRFAPGLSSGGSFRPRGRVSHLAGRKPPGDPRRDSPTGSFALR